MNDPEVTVPAATREGNLVAYSKALEAAGLALSLVKAVPSPFRSLGDQLVRAASSVPANLAEGHGRFGRDRMQHWRIAYGSAKEVDCHLRLLAQAGAVDGRSAETALRLFDEVRAITWRLLHPTPA
jgi:four helix bundle protein